MVKIKISRKKMVIIFDVLSMLFFMCLFLVPFLPFNKTLKTIFAMLFILLGYGCYYLILSIYFKWGNSHVEPTKRASFSATKEMISLFSGIIFTLVVGYIIDKFESLDNLNGGFLFIASAILILTVCNIICLSLIKKDDESEHLSDNEPIKCVLKNLFSNKNYLNIITLSVLWNLANYFSIGFMGVFKTNDLMISIFLIQIINIAGQFARMIFSKQSANILIRIALQKALN
jgi:Na+/melibiose symporter-like transporter